MMLLLLLLLLCTTLRRLSVPTALCVLVLLWRVAPPALSIEVPGTAQCVACVCVRPWAWVRRCVAGGREGVCACA